MEELGSEVGQLSTGHPAARLVVDPDGESAFSNREMSLSNERPFEPFRGFFDMFSENDSLRIWRAYLSVTELGQRVTILVARCVDGLTKGDFDARTDPSGRFEEVT